MLMLYLSNKSLNPRMSGVLSTEAKNALNFISGVSFPCQSTILPETQPTFTSIYIQALVQALLHNGQK
jgi:hypothetical protein